MQFAYKHMFNNKTIMMLSTAVVVLVFVTTLQLSTSISIPQAHAIGPCTNPGLELPSSYSSFPHGSGELNRPEFPGNAPFGGYCTGP